MTEATQLLTIRETAARLDLKPATLDKWRARRKDRRAVPLPFIRVGGKIRYRLSDIERFLDLRTITPGEKPRRPRAA
jgi:hypothetical protein